LGELTRRVRPATQAALELMRDPNDDRLLPMPAGFTAWRKRWQKLGRLAGVDTKNRGLQAIRRTGATLSKKAGQSAAEYLGHSPRSAGLAERYYLDPALLDDAPQLPPDLN
jgi:hypothetical protein